MSGINTVTLIGRVSKEIELKFLPSNGTAVVSLDLAVERKIKNKTANRYDVDFIPVVIWGKQAEVVAEHSGKGKLLGVTGRIQVRKWQTKDGDNRYTTEVVAEQIQILEWASTGKGSHTPPPPNEEEFPYGDDMTPVDDGDIPF